MCFCLTNRKESSNVINHDLVKKGREMKPQSEMDKSNLARFDELANLPFSESGISVTGVS
jgi:hypothetical protein